MVYLAPSPSPSPSYQPPDCSDADAWHILSVVVLVVVAFVAMLLLHALGSLRRQSSHGLLHNTVIAINTLSYPLVAYTIGRMNSGRCYVVDFALWAVFMLLLLGSTDNLTVCRLNDIDNWKSIYVKHFFKGLIVVYIVVNTSMFQKHHHHFPYLSVLMAILLVGVLKWYGRIASMRMVSKSYLSKNMKVISEYMQHKDNRLGPFDPVTMEGYRYLVAGEKYCIKRPGRTPWYNEEGLNLKLTTVEQIWKCKGNLLCKEQGLLLKDLCLSMALSKMLNRRFAGFNLSEAGLEKTHDFVFKGLLVAGDNGVDGHLSWACDATGMDGSVTRTVLVWHIATTLCKHHLDSQANEEDTRKEDTVTTATTLSQYCMHLLAFAPNLLPDHSSISDSLLEQSIEEAAELLKGCKRKENWCEMLMQISTHDHENHPDLEASLLVARGAHLARDLIDHIEEPRLRWKVLCDFWVEMMLYLSPSDDARGHLEALTRGGEFITHLWALLTAEPRFGVRAQVMSD